MEKEYKEFLKSHKMCDFQQSIEWGKLKEYWGKELILIRNKEGNIIASVQILIRKIPVFGNLMYVPRGPICDIKDKELLEIVTKKIRESAKKYNAFVIKIEPNVEKKEIEFKENIEKLGYKVNSTAMNFTEEIQARHNFRLQLKGKTKEEIFNSFSSKTRYNIRLANKKGVEIKDLGEEGLNDFYKLMKETGTRDNFRIRGKEYFEKIYKEFPEKNIKLKMAFYNNKPIAAILLIIYGKKMWYLYGASSNKYRNTMPNYLLQWEAIQLAIDMKLELYDFRGVSFKANGEEDGLYRFKKSFGTDFVELIGEIYIPFKPIRYKLYKIAEKKYRAMRSFLYKLKKNKLKNDL